MVDTPMFQEPVQETLPDLPKGSDDYLNTTVDTVDDTSTEFHIQAIHEKLDTLIKRSDTHTAAVNQFGGMLDYVVQTVAGFGQAIQKQGIMGLMKSMTGGGDNG
jgi:hypothetical protein